jgi:hypothetical protein
MNGGEPALIDTGNGFTVKYRGRYLYALNDPIKKVEQKLKHLDIKQNTLIFLPGLALGYGFKELLKLLPQHCHVLCVEIDQKIMNLALSRGLKSLLKDNRLTILRSQDPLKAIEVLNTIGMGEYRRVKTITLCGGYQLFPEQYKKISQALETAINSYWQNRMTLIHMGKLLVKNIFSNLHLLSKSIDIYQLRTAKPLVVLGAGPSLEDTLPIIKRIRKHKTCLFMCT